MYSFSTNLKGDMSTIEQQVTDALKEEGFGVLTEIDVQATLKEKLGIDQRPYKILGACNPHSRIRLCKRKPILVYCFLVT